MIDNIRGTNTRVPNHKFAHITARYLLVTFIPYYMDKNGGIWLERIWHQDLIRHLDYLHTLTLVAPRQDLDGADCEDPVLIDKIEYDKKIVFVGLKPQTSFIRALLSLPNTIKILWREIKKTEIVQSGIAGWPFPLGWVANPIALLLKRPLVLIVESAPWRLAGKGPFRLRDRVRASISEFLGRSFMRRAHLAIVTQPDYINTLRGSGSRGIEFVNPATWIDDNIIVTTEEATRIWTNKFKCTDEPCRFLFAGRLVKEKGVEHLLEAVTQCNLQNIDVAIDIIGNGPLLEKCTELEQTLEIKNFRILPVVEYGRPFFELIQKYYAVIVPSISDEQPRIIFDAYSQAVPVIASETAGIRSSVQNGVTGWIIPTESSRAIISTILEITNTPEIAELRGMAALKVARTNTHREMHRRRSLIICELINKLS